MSFRHLKWLNISGIRFEFLLPEKKNYVPMGKKIIRV